MKCLELDVIHKLSIEFLIKYMCLLLALRVFVYY